MVLSVRKTKHPQLFDPGIMGKTNLARLLPTLFRSRAASGGQILSLQCLPGEADQLVGGGKEDSENGGIRQGLSGGSELPWTTDKELPQGGTDCRHCDQRHHVR